MARVGSIRQDMSSLLSVEHGSRLPANILFTPHFMANRWGNNGNSGRFYLEGGAPKSLQMVIAAMKLKDTYSLEGKL